MHSRGWRGAPPAIGAGYAHAPARARAHRRTVRMCSRTRKCTSTYQVRFESSEPGKENYYEQLEDIKALMPEDVEQHYDVFLHVYISVPGTARTRLASASLDGPVTPCQVTANALLATAGRVWRPAHRLPALLDARDPHGDGGERDVDGLGPDWRPFAAMGASQSGSDHPR